MMNEAPVLSLPSPPQPDELVQFVSQPGAMEESWAGHQEAWVLVSDVNSWASHFCGTVLSSSVKPGCGPEAQMSHS